MNIKIGDKVAYIKYDISDWNSRQDIGWGYVFYIDDEIIGCAKPKYSPVYINIKQIFNTDKETKSNMKLLIENKINELVAKILKLTEKERDTLIKNKFERIKQQIINTSNNMVNSENETVFINRLKEICRQKTQLFSIKLSDLENIHKSNGAIMYKIKQLKDLLEKIDKENFE